MNTYTALILVDGQNATVSVIYEHNTTGIPVNFTHQSAGHYATESADLFPANTICRGTVLTYNGQAIDDTYHVGIHRTSAQWIEVVVKDKNGDAVDPAIPFPVEFSIP